MLLRKLHRCIYDAWDDHRITQGLPWDDFSLKNSSLSFTYLRSNKKHKINSGLKWHHFELLLPNLAYYEFSCIPFLWGCGPACLSKCSITKAGLQYISLVALETARFTLASRGSIPSIFNLD